MQKVYCSISLLLSFFCLLYAQDAEEVILNFNPERGFYENNFDLTLSTTPPGLTIRYTKDGTDPITSSTAIQGTSPLIIQVDPANTSGRDKAPGYCVSAVVIQADTAATKVITHTYIFANRVVELSPDDLTFVASDAHKLVRYKRTDVKLDTNASFILPKKPAGLLKNVLHKEEKEVVIEFDDKNAFITLSNYKLVCRLVEGNYPSYNSVIPADNPNKVIFDRLKLYNSLKRVSVFSNQASNLVRLQLTGNQLTVSAQDIDFSISAYERLTCQYEGDEMEIGFKSLFLIEILANLESSDVVLELSDPSRAGILLPVEKENEDEDILMLLMPMMINN